MEATLLNTQIYKMSLKFPLSLVGKRGGGNDLKANLLEWWDDADIIGKHNSISLGATPGTTIIGANGWNAWDLNGTDCVAGLHAAGYPLGAYAERTAAFVVYRNGDAEEAGAKALIGGKVQNINDYHYLGTRWGQRFYFRHKKTRYLPLGFNKGAWGSLVWVELTTGQGQIYWNGSLVVEVPVTDVNNYLPVQAWQTFLASPSLDVAVACLADRSWTQDDVTAFHNGGTFLQYADL